MGSLLNEAWLVGCERLEIRDAASVSLAREQVRTRAAAAGLAALATERLVSAVSELAHNQLAHAKGGTIGTRAIVRGGVTGLEVVAADRGPGIADPAAAYRGGKVTGSLGVGLGAAHRQVDELDADVRLGQGTCIRVRTFAAPVPRCELAIYGRPHPDEAVSGDDAAVARDQHGCTFAIVDGLGHGPLAREPAHAAMLEVLRAPDRDPVRLLTDCHAALHGSRGAVMAAARIEAHATPEGRTLTYASIGNIAARVIGVDLQGRPLPSAPGVLGTSSFPRRLVPSVITLAPREVFVACSDGIATRFDLTAEPALLREPALVLAAYLVHTFGRTTDDALVVVVR